MEALSDDILLTVIRYLDVTSWGRLQASSSRFRVLEQSHSEVLWENRIQSHCGNLRRPTTTTGTTYSWQSLGKNLYSGEGTYYGFCIDSFTSDFEPYPMKLIIAPHVETSSNHRMIWTTLDHAVSRVSVTNRTRSSNCGDLMNSISFHEAEQINGPELVIPNHYQGFFCGAAMTGVFTFGAFFLLREEAISFPRISNVFQWLNNPQGPGVEYHETAQRDFGSWQHFSGQAFSSLSTDDLDQTKRLPEPTSTSIDLAIYDLVPPTSKHHKALTTIIDFSRSFAGMIDWQVVSDVGAVEVKTKDVFVLLGIRSQRYDVLIVPKTI